MFTTTTNTCRVLKGKKPSECIQLIHDEYLKRICQESGFQGLKYRAGPMLLCHCPQPSVFTFVAFDDNEPKIEVPVGACPKCFEEWKGSGDSSEKVDVILQEQVSYMYIGRYNHVCTNCIVLWESIGMCKSR